MDETAVKTLERDILEAEIIVENIITSFIKEATWKTEIDTNLQLANSKATKSTQTEYMERTSRKERNRLLDNANKLTEKLTEEAKDDRIVELKVELAKRMEQLGSLEERVKGLLKCIGIMEIDLVKKDPAPKESDYVAITINQHQLMEVKKSQDDMAQTLKSSCDQINRIMDYLKAFRGLSLEDKLNLEDTSTVQDTKPESTNYDDPPAKTDTPPKNETTGQSKKSEG